MGVLEIHHGFHTDEHGKEVAQKPDSQLGSRMLSKYANGIDSNYILGGGVSFPSRNDYNLVDEEVEAVGAFVRARLEMFVQNVERPISVKDIEEVAASATRETVINFIRDLELKWKRAREVESKEAKAEMLEKWLQAHTVFG